MATFQKELHATKTDVYSLTVPAEWLESDLITSHSVTVDAKVIKNSSGVIGNLIYVSVTGVSEGGSILHFEYETNSGRSDCSKATVKVIADC